MIVQNLTAVCPAGNVGDLFLVIFFLIFVVAGFAMFALSIKYAYTSQVLHVGPHRYAVWNKFFFRIKDVPVPNLEDPEPARAMGDTNELSLVELIPEKLDCILEGGKITLPFIRIREGEKEGGFGSGLDIPDLERILEEVNAVISQAKNRRSLSACERVL